VPKDGEIEKEAIANIMNMLDKMNNVWMYKFSTSPTDDGIELKESPMDSVYYMTHSGASIRFKMANISKGLAKVVQPFAELIYFDKPSVEISTIPRLGYCPIEYWTQEFNDLISDKELSGISATDYKSSIKKYYLNGKLLSIPKNDKVIRDHNGGSVNKIYFENNT
jgi:DNA relaxase NicK